MKALIALALVLTHLPEARMSTTLEALRDLPAFEVRVAGKAQPDAPPGVPAVHVEWAWGTPSEDPSDGPLAEWQGHAADDEVVVTTPRGRLTLPPGRLRLYLAPAYDRRFTAPGAAPAFAREWIAEHPGPTLVLAWTLRPDRAYHARVGVESYWLPPRGPEGEPVEREALVLWISDAPFREGRGGAGRVARSGPHPGPAGLSRPGGGWHYPNLQSWRARRAPAARLFSS